ncbi:DM13 domain-containing protein [Nocardia amikacinitolerans]|uniref:DM13 domain-containing protein n=1 Tax=Nocardia amikacinitolerans TaxID=756689 RepID=UPI0020A30756|nr:DM13 domain-containing protein [Nocardia amikacinitolerans]MCP2293363.1 Electron transfer DM13 [Nocardia amikacinitolerans]
MVSVRKIARSPIAWVFTALVVVGLGAALVLFQPWRLVTDTTVNEAVPTAGPPGGMSGIDTGEQPPRTLATGTFISHEHGTSGTVSVLRLADGSRVLRVENLDTSDGPDLHVWLTDAPVLEGRAGWGVFDDGRHVDLGQLKGNKGSQNYAIPADADLAALTSVSIWCDRFNVSFGAAALRAA